MAPPRGQASYKKQPGVIAISKDQKSVSWTPDHAADGPPAVVISAVNVTNLQQTPESSAKVMLKIFAQAPGQSEAVAHVFTFTSKSDPRGEANAVKDTLANVIQAQKAAQNAAAATTSGGQSAAMTIANAISGGGRSTNTWEDDDKLKADIRLQQSLMQENPELQRTFFEAVKLKPESISSSQFTAQFWSSRIHLLRAHAIAQNQGRGKHNVFSELRREDGGTKMSLTQDQVRAIFEQYPVMRFIYDEVVPAKCKSETDFWSRFFQSQLFMKLRGLKFDPTREARDRVLDTEEFLNHPELTGLRPTPSDTPIPKFIDLEGNEENHSQRQGNRPDLELRSSALDKAPIIRKLNALSEKLMASVRPSDVDASAPIGMSEEDYEESLRLRDLAGGPEQQRIVLNIRDQSRFFSSTSQSSDANPFRDINPASAIDSVLADLTKTIPSLGSKPIPIPEFQELDPDDPEPEPTGSSIATAHILSLIESHRAQTLPIPPSSGLGTAIYDRLTLTHATTLEFLSQFWDAFLSGSPGRANEIASLVESLNKASERIEVIAQDAEKERQDKLKEAMRVAEDRSRKLGRKIRVDKAAIGGGATVVKGLLGPVLKALVVAVDAYRKAWEEQKGMDGEGG